MIGLLEALRRYQAQARLGAHATLRTQVPKQGDPSFSNMEALRASFCDALNYQAHVALRTVCPHHSVHDSNYSRHSQMYFPFPMQPPEQA